MAAIYYTIAAVALYFFSDWILLRIEAAAGRRFEYRTIIFFFILLLLALVTFTLIKRLTSG